MADIGSIKLAGNSGGKQEMASSGGLRIDDGCPTVQIVDELSSLSEFTGSTRTEPNLISRVNLNQVESSCAFIDGQIALDLRLAFEGALGPKAKKSSSDKPLFSYPFFVAVTNPSGVILAKEIFSASMTYERNEDSHTYFENMRQLIPISDRENAHRYKVMLGFQLSEEQLKYNRKYLVPVSNVTYSIPAAFDDEEWKIAMANTTNKAGLN